jgi:hypothetical protein
MPPIKTVVDPMMIASTPQPSPRRAAGMPAIKTVGAPGGMMGVGTPIVAVLTIISVTRAAKDIPSSQLLYIGMHGSDPDRWAGPCHVN